VLFEENDKGEDGDATHGYRKTDLAQMRLLVAQEQCPIPHDWKGEQGKFRQLGSDRTIATRARRHYLNIAKAAAPGDGNPKEPQRSAEKWEVVNSASFIGAARDGGIHGFRRKCIESGGEKNVAVEFAPRSRTGQECRG